MARRANVSCPVLALVLAALPRCTPKPPATPAPAHPRVAKAVRPPASRPSAQPRCPALAVPARFKQSRVEKGQLIAVKPTAEAARLLPGITRIGEMTWTTVLFNDESEGDDRHYERRTSSYTHPHESAGEDCLRIGKLKEVSAWADEHFTRLRGAPREKKNIRLRAPSVLPLEENRLKLPSGPDRSEDGDPNEIPGITIVPLTGLWQLQTKALVRVSANPKGSCPAASIP